MATPVNTPPPMSQNGAETPFQADSRQDEIAAQTYQNLVKSLIEWIAASKFYLKRRKHLSGEEKSKALAILSKQERLLTNYHSLYKPKASVLERELNDEFQGQAEMNRYAEFYEFPPFPIPDSADIYLPKPYDTIDIEVNNNAFAGYMLLGDKLISQLIDPSNLKEGDLILVMHRRNGNHPRGVTIGWFGKIEFGFLVLLYNQPNVQRKLKPYFIPIKQVLRFYKVTKLVRHLEGKKEVNRD